MAGRRISLGSLASENVYEPATSETAVPLKIVAGNPLNPRNDLGDLADLIHSLETMGQLQPCTAVSKLAYLAVYPEYRERIGEASYVVIMGGRRLAAARASTSISRIEITVKDSLAKSRESLAAAAVIENIERRDFDPFEEAHAVKKLVELFHSKQDVAKHLSRSNGWVTQRLALLNLHPELQGLLRSGKLPVRDARELAKLDAAEQVSAWEQRQKMSEFFTAVKNSKTSPDAETEAVPHPRREGEEVFYRGKKLSGAKQAITMLGGDPSRIANTLRAHLTVDDCQLLAKLLLAE